MVGLDFIDLCQKYPNVYAFSEDMKNMEKGITSDRFERFKNGKDGFRCASISDGGEGTNYAVCPDKFISEHIEDPSCEASEKYLSCCNYLGGT